MVKVQCLVADSACAPALGHQIVTFGTFVVFPGHSLKKIRRHRGLQTVEIIVFSSVGTLNRRQNKNAGICLLPARAMAQQQRVH
jgi:hypothetical protein